MATMTRREIRDITYRTRINPVQMLDSDLSEYIFGKNNPFKFCSNYNFEQLESNVVRLSRVLDAYEYIRMWEPSVLQLIDQLKEFNLDNILDRADDYKKIIKGWRKDNSLSLKEQFVHSFLLSIRVKSELITDACMMHYINQFDRAEVNNNNDFYEEPYDEEALQFLASWIERMSFKKYERSILKPPATSFSSTGHKKMFDQNYLVEYCTTHNTIDKRAKRFLLSSFRAAELAYGISLQNATMAVSSLKEEDGVGIEFLPRLMTVSQNNGKVYRVVIEGNDFADMALRPYMDLIKHMMQDLPSNCSVSTTAKYSMLSKVTDTCKRIHSYQPIIGGTIRLNKNKKTKESLLLQDSEMEDIDESNATERINGRYMVYLPRKVYSFFSEQTKAMVGLSEEYFDLAEEILMETPYWCRINNTTYISYTYGTGQGLPGSWDDLNFFTFSMEYLSFVDLCKGLNYRKPYIMALNATFATALCNGDDGAYPSEIGSRMKTRIQMNALEGVISLEKSASETELGYVAFSSAYVRHGKIPRLSNLKMISSIEMLSDSDSLIGFYIDRYMNMQLKKLEDILNEFREHFNCIQIPVYSISNDEVRRAMAYREASRYAEFYLYQDQEFFIPVQPVQGTEISFDEHSCVALRAQNLLILNHTLSSDRFTLLCDGASYKNYYDIVLDERLKDVKEQIANQRNSWIINGMIPYFANERLNLIFDRFLNIDKYHWSEIQRKYTRLFNNQIYNVTYNGYGQVDDQVIEVTFRFSKEN